MDVIAKIYRSKNGKKDIRTVVSHTIHYGFIYDGEEVVDEVLVMIMRGPHTYTGEDTVEIDCHGGVYAMKRVLETVLKNGAAGPVSGRGSYGCHSGKEFHGTQKFCRTVKGFCTAGC